MVENRFLSNEQKRTVLAEKLWLRYFNCYLYENNLITETQRNRMILKIDNRNGSTNKTKELP